MAMITLLVLLTGSMGGLLIGGWQAALALTAASVTAGVLLTPEAGALGMLAATGFLAGARLRQVVAEQY